MAHLLALQLGMTALAIDFSVLFVRQLLPVQ